jgi:hypothetical protein
MADTKFGWYHFTSPTWFMQLLAWYVSVVSIDLTKKVFQEVRCSDTVPTKLCVSHLNTATFAHILVCVRRARLVKEPTHYFENMSQ